MTYVVANWFQCRLAWVLSARCRFRLEQGLGLSITPISRLKIRVLMRDGLCNEGISP